MLPKAGKIFRSKKGRHVRIEQIRTTGKLGLGYALAQPCGPQGRFTPRPFLRTADGPLPITIFLAPDGTMPPGYMEVTA